MISKMMSSLPFIKKELPLAEQKDAADTLRHAIEAPYRGRNVEVVGEMVVHHKLLGYGVSQSLETN